jgi:hypothetical protein
VLEGVLLEIGMGVLNPNFDVKCKWVTEELNRCCKVLMVKPDQIVSTDETKETTNMSGGSAAQQCTVILVRRSLQTWRTQMITGRFSPTRCQSTH